MLTRCDECPLKTTPHQPVLLPRGDVAAPVVIVGQSPGEREVEQGAPFVGPAGQCLTSCLQRAGWPVVEDDFGETQTDPKGFLLTNAVRCRPPDGFNFTRKSLDPCNEVLREELRAHPRKLIICVGNEAWAAVMGGNPTGVEKSAGIVHQHPELGCPVLWTHHPAKVLYTPSVMAQFIEHLSRARLLLSGGGSGSANPAGGARRRLIRDFHGLRKLQRLCQERGRAGELMAFDIETTGTDRFNDKIIGIAFAFYDVAAYVHLRHGQPHMEQEEVVRRGKTKLVDVERWDLVDNPGTLNPEGREIIREILEDPDIRKCAHFSKFDCTFLQQEMGVRVRNVVADSLLLQTLLEENLPLSLKYVSRQIYGAEDYDAELKPYFKPGKNLSMAPLRQVAEYACLDALYTCWLGERLYLDARCEGVAELHDRLMLPLSFELGEVELRGMRVDQDAVREVGEEIEKRMEALRQDIDNAAGVAGVAVPWRKDGQVGINPNSDDDIRHVLFKHFGLISVRQTETGKDSVDKETRAQLLRTEGLQPPARAFLEAVDEYSRLTTYLGTFVKGTLGAVRDDGRVHTTYGYNDRTERSPATGRLSSNSPNAQNVIEGFQPCYIPPDGWRMVQADLSGAEMRCWGALSVDKELLRIFSQPGVDFHREISAALLDKLPEEVSNEERQKLKRIGFSTIYGGDYHIISELLHCSEGEAEMYQQRLFSAFPRGKAWLDERVREVHERHRVVSPLGRIRHLVDIISAKKDVRREAERQAMNSVIQGLASDCNLMALIATADHLRWEGADKPWLPREEETSWEWLGRRRNHNAAIEQARAEPRSYQARIVNTVHDCIIVECPQDEVAAVEEILRRSMCRRPYPEWPEELLVEIEVTVTERWHADELDLEEIVRPRDDE